MSIEVVRDETLPVVVGLCTVADGIAPLARLVLELVLVI